MPLLDRLTDARILVVDDDDSIVKLLSLFLRQAGFTDIHMLTDPRQVFTTFVDIKPDLVLLDMRMPHMDGLEVLASLRPALTNGLHVPVIILTGDTRSTMKERALAAGASDFIAKPFEEVEVRLRIDHQLNARRMQLQLHEDNISLEARVRTRTVQLEEAQQETIMRLARAAEHRDDATGEHTRRVANMAGLLAEHLGLPLERVEAIKVAAVLHDVGKIAVPDAILLKPGMLNLPEVEVMQMHTTVGADILSGAQYRVLNLACEIALSHHERWDGHGYPQRLAGDMIPLAGRIVAVADAFDAMTNDRPYRQAWPVDHALIEIERCSGAQFDPTVVAALMQTAPATTFG